MTPPASPGREEPQSPIDKEPPAKAKPLPTLPIKTPPVKPSPNEICNTCLKWAQFGQNCRVYWEGKKFCTMRVTTIEDWDNEHQLLTR
jgi:hypothetical protein